ncbi:unnamed protein product [Peniophora sp. CBMAI 1063]|nr:unnamed protein product [Peniophora sp. CBMAI 1063]
MEGSRLITDMTVLGARVTQYQQTTIERLERQVRRIDNERQLLLLDNRDLSEVSSVAALGGKGSTAQVDQAKDELRIVRSELEIARQLAESAKADASRFSSVGGTTKRVSSSAGDPGARGVIQPLIWNGTTIAPEIGAQDREQLKNLLGSKKLQQAGANYMNLAAASAAVPTIPDKRPNGNAEVASGADKTKIGATEGVVEIKSSNPRKRPASTVGGPSGPAEKKRHVSGRESR